MAAASIYKGMHLFITQKALLLNDYIELHGDPEGNIPATFQIIYLVSAWDYK
jgi:hypothetical protein